MTAPRIPPANAAIHRAAFVIFEAGPQTPAALFASIDFGKAYSRLGKIDSAIRNGWLIDIDGKVGISDRARTYFSGKPEASAPKYVGQMATIREPYAYEAAPLSKRHIPNSKGNRADVPEFSIRDGVRCYSVGGGSV